MKTNWLNNTLLIIFILLPGAYAQAQTIVPVTAKQAVDLAFKNVMELKNANIDEEIRIERLFFRLASDREKLILIEI